VFEKENYVKMKRWEYTQSTEFPSPTCLRKHISRVFSELITCSLHTSPNKCDYKFNKSFVFLTQPTRSLRHLTFRWNQINSYEALQTMKNEARVNVSRENYRNWMFIGMLISLIEELIIPWHKAKSGATRVCLRAFICCKFCKAFDPKGWP
jgi:hypothetical protein